MLNHNDLDLPIFQEFHDRQLDDLRPVLECREYPANQVILRQGDAAKHVYLVGRGVLEVRHLPYDGPQMRLDRLQEGDVFGWSALLGRATYTATVVTLEESCLYAITLGDLQSLCRFHHDTGVVLLEKMARSVSNQPGVRFKAVMRVLERMMNCEPNH
jgi:CRP-like cAMP-binding protein